MTPAAPGGAFARGLPLRQGLRDTARIPLALALRSWLPQFVLPDVSICKPRGCP